MYNGHRRMMFRALSPHWTKTGTFSVNRKKEGKNLRQKLRINYFTRVEIRDIELYNFIDVYTRKEELFVAYTSCKSKSVSFAKKKKILFDSVQPFFFTPFIPVIQQLSLSSVWCKIFSILCAHLLWSPIAVQRG